METPKDEVLYTEADIIDSSKEDGLIWKKLLVQEVNVKTSLKKK